MIRGGEINKLPYDVIVYFLQLPIIDIDTILQFIKALPQYRSLGYYVLKQYKLPNTYLQAITDQEGKRQYITQFQFHSLNHHDIDYVTFIVNPSHHNDHNKKRYISNLSKAARPQLKNITFHHYPFTSSTLINKKLLERNKSMASTLSPSSSTSTSSSSPSLSSSSTLSSSYNNKENDDHHHKEDQPKMKITSLLESINLIQSHSLSLKYGLHTIYPQHYKKSTMKWRYIYHVSHTDETIDPWLLYSPDQFSHDQNKKKNEKKKKDGQEKKLKKNKNDMNVSPLCIIVPLHLLTKNDFTSTTTTIMNHTSTKNATSIPIKSIHHPFWYSKYIKVMKKCIPQV